mgnify:FL=1
MYLILRSYGSPQLQVAERIGVSKAMISTYETASKAPSIEVLIRLSRLFGGSVDYLVCVDAPKMIDVSGVDEKTLALITALLNNFLEKSSDIV